MRILFVEPDDVHGCIGNVILRINPLKGSLVQQRRVLNMAHKRTRKLEDVGEIFVDVFFCYVLLRARNYAFLYMNVRIKSQMIIILIFLMFIVKHNHYVYEY